MKSPAYIENERLLAEINSTLKKKSGFKLGKIGIFLPANNGDVMSAMSVLKYADMLWPDKQVIWFCNPPVADAFRYNDAVDEVRPYPWEGAEVDFNTNGMRNEHNNRLNMKKAKEFEITADLSDGYFPAPWMFEPSQRPPIEYPNISRQVFGVGDSWEWHPYLCFSQEEREQIAHFVKALMPYRTIMLETVCHSNQSAWNDNLTRKTMELCRYYFGHCNFLFAAEENVDRFNTSLGNDILGSILPLKKDLTIRQTALLINHCSLFVGVSSGISVATSCWGSKPVPKLQYCGNRICSTAAMATGPIEVIECEKYTSGPDWDHTAAEQVFETKLREILNQLK